MIEYPFTNDMRTDTLHESLKTSAEYFKDGINGNDKSNQNVSNTMKIYFGLDVGKVNTDFVLNNEYNAVIAEAVKKFQFPYPRTSTALKEQKEEHLQMAPMRDLVKLLYFKYVANIGREDADVSVSLEQFKDYMLANPKYATGEKDIHDVFNDIQNGESSFSYENNVTVLGGENGRMPRYMFAIVSKLPWIKEVVTKNKKSLALDFSEAKNDAKFWDLINYNEYWHPNDEKKFNEQKADYIDYLQIGQTKESTNIFKGGHNIIYYGAPGTGKSYRVSEEIKHDYIADYSSKQGSPDVFRATLHPEYSYSDFVGQLLPKVEQERVTYEFTPGVFTSALKHAISYPMRPTFLILEEMSRANVAAVFGDIFQLLDRDEDGRSEYTINNGLIAQNAILSDADGATDPNSCSVYLPENLFIVGTVNTSDQNVFAMDTAFKRRFTWEYVSPKVDEASFENNPDIEISSDMTVSWYKLYTTLNDFITRDLGLTEDKQIGPYFIKFDHSQMNPGKLVKDKLLQYLWEDVDVVARRMNGGARSLFDSKIASFADLYDSFGQKTVFSNKFIEKLKGSASNDSVDESDDADGSERAED